MPEPREPRSIIEAAEQAAAAGNYASAETLLREAALVQEARLGPLHPDLANTLNNLGVVCEITGNLVAAERSFRRAFAIATTVLAPDHPFVATSRKNLGDFCAAQGTPIELPPAAPTVTTPATPPMPPLRTSEIPAQSHDVQPVVQPKSVRPLAIGALGPIAMLIVILVAYVSWLNTAERAESSPPIATDAPLETPAPSNVPSPVEPIPSPDEATTTTRSEPEVRVSTRTSASTAENLTVLKARLCADLDDWRCDPPDDPVPTGPLFFYTQVKSTSATTVQHRWYRDDRLSQSVALRIETNPSGYRTFSRTTMNGDSAGDWRVELRTEDGVVLHEERFSVR